MQHNSLDTTILRRAAEQSNLTSAYSQLMDSDYILADTVKEEAEGIFSRYRIIERNLLSFKPASIEVKQVIEKMISGIPNPNDCAAIEDMAREEARNLKLKEHANKEQLDQLKRKIAKKMNAITRKMLSYIAISPERTIPYRSDDHFPTFNALKKELKSRRGYSNNDTKIITISACYAFCNSCDVDLYSTDNFILNAGAGMVSEIVKKTKPEYKYSQITFKIKTPD